MAEVIRRFTATIPAGTAKTAPATVNMAFPPMEVVEIEIVVPPGPRGQMGFKLTTSGTQVIPFPGDDYIVTDDEVIHWPLEHSMDSGAWQVTGYNTGAFNHSIEVRFLCRLVGSTVGPDPLPIPGEQLSFAPGP